MSQCLFTQQTSHCCQSSCLLYREKKNCYSNLTPQWRFDLSSDYSASESNFVNKCVHTEFCSCTVVGSNLDHEIITSIYSWQSCNTWPTCGSLWKMTTLPPLSPVARRSPSWLNSTQEMMSASVTSSSRVPFTCEKHHCTSLDDEPGSTRE